MKKLLILALGLIAVAATAAGVYSYRKAGPEVQVTTLPVSRGDIVQSVGATGTLEAVTTVQVGSQVSGIIRELYADFNSIVRKGQVIARLDPSLFETQVEQAKANLVRSQTEVERLKVSLEDARTKLKRAEGLAAKKLAPAQDLETAQVNVRQVEAQIKSAVAAAEQSQASLNQNQVNLDHTIITAPIDGIVISRNVDVGQTVAASMSAPTLFILAADLTKMQARASVDESDVGMIRPGQAARFRVDAYPTDNFVGTVKQVRLQPVVVQNVVTYVTVIDVPNPELKLKPGMTANVTIEIARRDNALRIPNATLRFRPTSEMFLALNQTPPADLQQRGMGAGQSGAGVGAQANASGAQSGQTSQGGQPSAPAAGAAQGARAPQVAADGASAQRAAVGAQQGTQGQPERSQRTNELASPATARGPSGRGAAGGGQPGQVDRAGAPGGGGMDPEARARFQERMANMTPEERAQMMQRFRSRQDTAGGDPAGQPAGGRQGGPRAEPARSVTPAVLGTAQTIDSLFGPLPVVQSAARVWLYLNKQLKMVRVRTGITDGTYTELVGEDLQASNELVTEVNTGLPSATPRGQTPFMPGGQRQGGFGNPMQMPRGGPGIH